MSAIFIRGNLTDGLRAFGPYPTPDEALEANDGYEGWMMDLQTPDPSLGLSSPRSGDSRSEVVKMYRAGRIAGRDHEGAIDDVMAHQIAARADVESWVGAARSAADTAEEQKLQSPTRRGIR